mgnify:CR=1 FL=1
MTMDDKLRNEIALFKFSLIAPVINGSLNEPLKEYLEKVCVKTYEVPGKGPRELSPKTIRQWLYAYQRYGIDGLKRKPRNDKGASRALTSDVSRAIQEFQQLFPQKTVTALYEELLAGGFLGSPPVSLSTVGRYLKKIPLPSEPEIERKRFVFEFANDCWQTDALSGPYLTIDGKKKATYLIAFLDDASRLLVHGEFFFEENSKNLQIVLKKAILKRGIPKRIFTDNGKIFDSLQLRLICASLGVLLSHARPYSPASKGKIERVFRTFRTQFLSSLDLQELKSLEDLNAKFLSYVESTYNQKVHSSLDGLSPMKRYLKDKEHFRFIRKKELLDQIFLHEVMRKVNRDATITLLKKVYEVPQKFIGRQVTVQYDPEDLSRVYVKNLTFPEPVMVYPVQAVDNSKIPRKQNLRQQIDFARLYGGDH